AWRFDPGAGQLPDHYRQLGRLQVLANVLDQVDEVGLVLGDSRLRMDAVVPAVIPDEAGQFMTTAVVIGEVSFEVRERLANFRYHFLVIGPDFAAGTGWSKVLVEALAAPAGLDEQHLLLEMIADDMAELQLRPEVMFAAVRSVTERERACLERSLFRLV